MAFFDNVKGKLSQASQTTVQKTKDLSEIAKLKTQVMGAEKQINDLYGKLGYEIYAAYSQNPLPEGEAIIKQLNDLHANIEAWNAQIKVINTVPTCPQCGTKLNRDMPFCTNCGCRVADAAPVEVPTVAPAPVAAPAAMESVFFPASMDEPDEAPAPAESVPAASAFCSNCGATVAEDAMFCTICGTRLG